MKNVKELLVEQFKKSGIPAKPDDCRSRHVAEISEEDFGQAPALNNVLGLTFDQAFELIEYYSKGFFLTRKSRTASTNTAD